MVPGIYQLKSKVSRRYETGLCILLLLFLPCHSQVSFWEELVTEERRAVLSDSNTYRPAVDYYNGSFGVSDDSATFQMLDEISAKGTFNPLHFYVFNEILYSADSALSKVMGHYSLLMILDYPKELIEYFSAFCSPKTPLIHNKYVGFLGRELYFNQLYMRYEIESERDEQDFTYRNLKAALLSEFSDPENLSTIMCNKFLEQLLMEVKKQGK